MKDIKNYEGLYAITEDGRVWSYRSNKYLKSCITSRYLTVNLYKDKKRKQHLIHRLVAEAYIPNPDNKKEVNHKDDNKTNNNVNNLEWMTHQENCNYGSFVKNRQKPVYCVELDKIFDSAITAAKELKIDNSVIGKCCRGTLKTAGGYHWRFANE